MLLELIPELRALVARKLCARDLVRLSRVSKQVHALCVEVGERAVREMLAAGEDDAPLPTGLGEHVLRRLARLCGVRLVPAAFAEAMFDATADMMFRRTYWDLAALEKAYIVLSECELEEHAAVRCSWRFKSELRDSYSQLQHGPVFDFLSFIFKMLDQDRCDFCVARKHVDFAIDSLYARGHEHTMARSRRLMERAADEDDPNDVDAEHAILARAAAREEKDEELDLAREDKLGVLIEAGRADREEWWSSCEAFFSVAHTELEEEVYYPKMKPDVDWVRLDDGCKPWFDYGTAPAPCSNPLCCHTWRNSRNLPRDGARVDVNYTVTDDSLAEVMRAPNTGRLRAFDCPRGLRQRATRAEFRKWRRESRKNAKAVLESLGFPVVEGVRMGDAPGNLMPL